MSENNNNNNTNKSNKYWCNMFNMSKKQRNTFLQTEREQGYWSYGDKHPDYEGVLFNVYGAEKQDGTRAEKWLTVDEFEQRNEQLKANSRDAPKTRTARPRKAKTKPKVVKQMKWPVMPIEVNINRWKTLYKMNGKCVLNYCPKWIQCHLQADS